MYQHKTKIRVRYGETDKMGYLYYGNYAQYFEVGRVEAMRSLGLVYAELEDRYHVMLPVSSYETKYVRPARYDELLTVTTHIIEMPNKFMKFYTEIHNEKDELVNIGKVTLAFVSTKGKRRGAPGFMKKILKKHF